MHEHDSQNAFYRSPFGAVERGTKVKLRFFTAKETKAVFVHTETEMYAMEKECEMCGGQMFVLEFAPWETCFYRFRAVGETGETWYGNNAASLGGRGEEGSDKSFQITVYAPYALPPSYAKGIVYQIFPDRFCRGGERKESGIPRAWGETPYFRADQFGGEYRANDFFGGTLWGVAEKLPYLKSLGISWIYLNPIFDTSSNHGYNTRDYMHAAAHFGGDAAFSHLAKKAKEMGIRLLLDGVFSHTGDDSIYFQSARQDENSPYRDWYTFTDTPPFYEAWWGIPSLPNVREEIPSYMEFMLGENGVLRHWLRQGADGWRLDVADELPDGFLDGLRTAVKTENPDAVIIGEVWEDASNKISYGARRRYLTGRQLDSVMHYPMRNAIIDFVRGKNDAAFFRARVLSLMENYPPPAFFGALSFLSSHDVPRILTVLGDAPENMGREEAAAFRLSPADRRKAVRRLRVALALLMTMPGVPCIYYGDEAGLEGCGDPFCRGTYPWEKEDAEVLALYKEMLALRQENSAFSEESLSFFYAEGRVLGFLRGETTVFINGGEETEAVSYGGQTVFVPPMEYKIASNG